MEVSLKSQREKCKYLKPLLNIHSFEYSDIITSSGFCSGDSKCMDVCNGILCTSDF